MKKDMNHMHGLMAKGESYFGSGGYTTEEFNKFARDFKKSFGEELKKAGAVLTNFCRGHFYLSGFFRKKEQLYYFSISDVRDGFGAQMLYRTAKHNKDFTGGHNQYVQTENGMANNMHLQ